MNMEELKRKYWLVNPDTPEDLETRRPFAKVLKYGDKIMMTDSFFNGFNNPSYFVVIYDFLTEDHSCEGLMEISMINEELFIDEGHAIAWAIEFIDHFEEKR